jgi:predicted nucleic acid-binding protein
MLYFFDSSVIIAGLITKHPKYSVASPWLEKAIAKKIKWAVAPHSLAECYAVLSTLPVSPRIDAHTARRLIAENIEPTAKIVSLTAREYLDTISEASLHGFAGGIIYDAVILKAAHSCKASQLLTLNGKDFLRLEAALRDGAKKLVVPL